MSGRGRSNGHPARGNGGRGGRGERNVTRSSRGGALKHDTRRANPEGGSVDKIHFGTDLVELRKRFTNHAAKHWPMLVEVFTDQSYVFNDMPTKQEILRTMQAIEDQDLVKCTGQRNAIFRSSLEAISADYVDDHDDGREAKNRVPEVQDEPAKEGRVDPVHQQSVATGSRRMATRANPGLGNDANQASGASSQGGQAQEAPLTPDRPQQPRESVDSSLN